MKPFPDMDLSSTNNATVQGLPTNTVKEIMRYGSKSNGSDSTFSTTKQLSDLAQATT